MIVNQISVFDVAYGICHRPFAYEKDFDNIKSRTHVPLGSLSKKLRLSLHLLILFSSVTVIFSFEL